MKITRNPNGSILLEPEGEDEILGLEYEFSQRGPTALKEMLEKHARQRKDQRDYDQINQSVILLRDLSEADRADVLTKLANNIKAKPKKGNNG